MDLPLTPKKSVSKRKTELGTGHMLYSRVVAGLRDRGTAEIEGLERKHSR